MEDAQIELLWITSPPNMYYLSGYDAWSFYVHQGLLVELGEPMPIWIGRGIDLACAKLTSILDDENLFGYDDKYVTGDSHAMTFVAETIKRKGWGTRRIGVEMDTHYYSAQADGVLRQSLPDAQFCNADKLVNWIRLVKSPQEIEYMKQAGEITDLAMRSALEMIEPGIEQNKVAGEIFKNLIAGHPAYFGDMPDYQTIPMGAKTAAPHLTWSDDPFRIGEVCTLELGANRFRYTAPLARTIFLGEPTPYFAKLQEVVRDGLEAALGAIKPGATCEMIEHAWRKEISKSNVIKKSRIGYSVGIGYPPDWGERTASIADGDKTCLQPGMTMHLMLGIWRDEHGYELSETFCVTETGCFCLSGLPREMTVK